MRVPRVAVARTHRLDDYLESVRRAGGEPWVLEASTDLSPTGWSGIAGVLLTGGPDVDPRLYGEAPHTSYEPARQGRDAFEIELVVRAMERDLPVLAICRGIQVMNVAGGGTLIQDIPSGILSPLDHQLRTPACALAHAVDIASGSALSRNLGHPEGTDPWKVCVNSRHHQAVGRVAPGFVVAATAPDGVIEAIERPGARFCVGVQWHPENFWRTGEFDTLFAAFVQACHPDAPR